MIHFASALSVLGGRANVKQFDLKCSDEESNCQYHVDYFKNHLVKLGLCFYYSNYIIDIVIQFSINFDPFLRCGSKVFNICKSLHTNSSPRHVIISSWSCTSSGEWNMQGCLVTCLVEWSVLTKYPQLPAVLSRLCLESKHMCLSISQYFHMFAAIFAATHHLCFIQDRLIKTVEKIN